PSRADGPTAPGRSGGAAAAWSAGPGAGPVRGRRRFSLPPLDEDHEKVSRSIESFLSSGDGSDAETAGGAPAPNTRPTASGATTVALVAIDGLGGDAADDAILTTLERALRATA